MESTESRVPVALAQGQFRNPGWVMSATGSQYQMTGEGTADREDSVCAVVNCTVRNGIRLNC
jgi:hypothetical protein